jgi:hypothetical protein
MIPENEEAQNFPSTFCLKSVDTQAVGNLQTVLKFTVIKLIQLMQLHKFLSS